MANKIVLKKSSVASKVPLVSDLDYGEVALNYQDGKIYYKTALNAIAAFSAVPTYASIVSGLGYTPLSTEGGSVTGTLSLKTTTIDGGALTNVPALTINNLGAGNGGLVVGALNIGHQQDHSRLTAFYVANKALRYTHGGVGVAGQGIHRFGGDTNSSTSAGALGSMVDIVAPSAATNMFQCRQADETTVFNVDYAGKVTHNGIIPTDGNNIDQIKTITKSLTLTTDWQDTGIKSIDINTGTYIVQLIANDTGSGGTNNNEYYSGTMSWYSGETNSALELPTDEIPLHRAGGSGDGALYLRTYRTATADPDNLKLQIYSNTANASAANYVFKFRRII